MLDCVHKTGGTQNGDCIHTVCNNSTINKFMLACCWLGRLSALLTTLNSLASYSTAIVPALNTIGDDDDDGGDGDRKRLILFARCCCTLAHRVNVSIRNTIALFTLVLMHKNTRFLTTRRHRFVYSVNQTQLYWTGTDKRRILRNSQERTVRNRPELAATKGDKVD